MTLASSEVRVAGTGELYLAPVGTAAPTDPSTDPAAAWQGYGYTTEDGVVLSKSVEREGVPAWQSSTPVRYLVTGQEFTIAATFLQSNAEVVQLWLGAGAFASGKAEVPIDPPTMQFALLLRWVDDTINTILTLPKVEITETGDVSLLRTGATSFPITFGALAPDSGSVLATWMTDDPAFEAA